MQYLEFFEIDKIRSVLAFALSSDQNSAPLVATNVPRKAQIRYCQLIIIRLIFSKVAKIKLNGILIQYVRCIE